MANLRLYEYSFMKIQQNYKPDQLNISDEMPKAVCFYDGDCRRVQVLSATLRVLNSTS